MSQHASSQDIGGIQPIVPRVEDRRDRPRRQRPFPRIPDEKESEVPDEEESEAPSEPDESEPKPPDSDAEEHRIDVIVRGRTLPTGQFLPGAPFTRTIH